MTVLSPDLQDSLATLALALRQRDEHLESVKTLVGQLAHDFNNSLVPLLGYATLIKEQTKSDAPIVAHASKLEQAARKSEAYLSRVLLELRPQRSSFQRRIDFAAFVQKVVSEWEGQLPATAAIRVQSQLAPCTLLADENHWRTSIRHLLENARLALITGGTIEVTLQAANLSADQAAALNFTDADVLELSIRDDGIGMTEQTLKRACDPFFSTRPKNQGMGLGLTQVHSVVHFHGGQILIESAEETGTKVTIWLPHREETLAKTRVPRPSASSAATQRAKAGKVLLVDSDPIGREGLKAYLRRVSFDVIAAPDGFEGIRLFQKHAPEIRAVIAKVCLPKMSGFEFHEKIRTLNPEVRTVLIDDSANAMESDLMKKPSGTEGPIILRLPFPIGQLREAVLG